MVLEWEGEVAGINLRPLGASGKEAAWTSNMQYFTKRYISHDYHYNIFFAAVDGAVEGKKTMNEAGSFTRTLLTT